MPDRRLRIRIVLAPQNAGWVIGKMAHRLSDALCALGHESLVSPEPDPSADVNHWMSFAFAEGCATTLNTMFVTHIDDPFKVKLVKDLLNGPVQMALCMSYHAVEELAGFGVRRDRLWYVLPAIDDPIPPRRIRVGITTRVYDDGRKREALLVRLASQRRLDAFHFAIYGAGWEAVIPRLEQSGATVHYDPGSEDWQGDYARIRAAIPDFDYYLYLGMDEGSLGTLDALSAGVRTIVTAQGFHMALPGGIDHPFTDYAGLCVVFDHLAAEHASRGARLAHWTWESYAREHAGVWEAMLRAKPADPSPEALAATQVRNAISPDAAQLPSGRIASGRWDYYLRALAPARIRGAVARSRWLRPLRKLIGY